MRIFISSFFLVAFCLVMAISCSDDNNFWESFIPETDDEPTAAQVNGYVFQPGLVDATDENVQQLTVPEGFVVNKFAEDLGMPRIIKASSNGHVYVTDRDAGVVMLLEDTNDDGVADRNEIVATIEQAHGLAMQGDEMFIIGVREMYRASINADGTLGQPQLIADDLPDGGQHPNRTMAFGPDGMLYLSVGSTCNACPESNVLHATMLRMNPDGSNKEIFAKGLRNTIGFGWHPETSEFWGLDHGIDWLGDTEQLEEVNKIEQGNNYGWPYIFDDGQYNPSERPQGDTTYSQYRDMSTNPVLGYEAHSAPMDMVFYTGDQFPAEYRNDVFVAMRGSWNRSNPVGYKIARLRFENGQPVAFEDFMTGFLVNNNRSHFARPVGMTQLPDGSLLMSDDTNGVIYRISYGQPS